MTTTAPQPVTHVPPGPNGTGSTRYAVFIRCQQLFGVSIELVREVLPGQALTFVPRAQEHVLGVLNLRGEILPVVVADTWLGLPAIADDPNQPILVLRRGDLLMGLRVDSIWNVLNIPAPEVQPHPTAGQQTCLSGIWYSENRPAITLISGNVLLDAVCQDLSERM